MSSLPTFPLFPDPVKENVFVQSKDACECCGTSRGWKYTGPIYRPGSSDIVLCPWCIADGSAAAKLDCTFCDVQAKVPREDYDLVEKRTPGFESWQDNHWLACCGRACVYLGEAEEADLRGRWASAVDSMVEDGFTRDRLWKEVLEGVRRAGTVCVYVFQCRVCSRLSAYWDMS